VFYGWWIVLAGIAIEFVIGGLFAQAYGAYVVLLRAELGWSATLLSFGFALVRVEHGLLGPLQGWLVDRHGPRRVVSVGVTVLAIGLILFSQVTTTATLFAALFVIAVGASLSGFASLNVAVVNWFAQRRGTALGIAAIGNYAGSLLLPFVVLSFGLFGWRATAALSAVVVLSVGLPAAQVLRHHPETYGLLPDGAKPALDDPPRTPSPGMLTARDALRTRQFWCLSFGHAAAILVVSALLVHLVPHLTGSLGYTLAEASGFVVLLSLVTIVGTLVGGAAGDHLDRRNLLVACMGGHTLGLLLIGYATTGWMVGAFVLMHGFAWGVRGPLMSAVRADYFGRRAYGTISGMSALVVMTGSIAGPIIVGVGYDVTGSYTIGFTTVAAFAAIGAGFFVLAANAAAVTASRQVVAQTHR
jgi:sugar phosphate permease